MITPMIAPTRSISIGSNSDSIVFILSSFSSLYSSERAFESFLPLTSSSEALKKAFEMTLFFIVFDESFTAWTKVTPELMRIDTIYENFRLNEKYECVKT